MRLEKPGNSGRANIYTKLRYIFYAHMLMALSGFVFTPFKTVETVSSYERQTIRAKNSTAGYRGIFNTNSGKKYTVSSIRLKDAHFSEGDTILVLRNFYYKLEGVKHKNAETPYFLETKWVFCFIWFFLGGLALISERFHRSNDIVIRNRLTILLLFVMALYFFI